MIVRRMALLAGALLLGTTGLRAAGPIEADPHELYERGREYLAHGQLQEAATAFSSLSALIAKRPGWDPEGAFAKELLPPLIARLERLQGAAGKLDDFTGQALQNLKPPDMSADISTVHDYTTWAASAIQRLRAERDRIIGAELSDPEERALLTRTENYARTEHLLEADVLKKLADTAGTDILGLLNGDPRLESVLTRFRQLQREVMQSTAERDQFQRHEKDAAARNETILRTLASLVTESDPDETRQADGRPTDVSYRFASFLDGEGEAMRSESSLTRAHRDVLLASLDRYRRTNRALVAAGLGSDQSQRIEALARAVAGIPLEPGSLTETSPINRAGAVLVCALALCTGFLAWLSLERGRRLAAFQRAGGHGTSLMSHEVVDRDAGQNAA